ncbi:leptin-B [Kryptolebias marmoratus]|uniref:Leptin-B-like n=1 Tax=Kryptolebias marmoratus TaxID=37003 RepID=A0A3Q3A6R8_KRYMA|nr:leptin-B [Kryptolebias marmoratus]
MCIPLRLLYVFLMASHDCTSLPTKGECIRNNIHGILDIAQITLVHIKLKTKWQVLSQVEATSAPVSGLTGISNDLGQLDNELQSLSTDLLSQIQADVSSLDGRVRSLALMMDCPVPDKPSARAGEQRFPDSQHYVTLAKVQHYLESLRLNRDKLTVC